VELKKKTDANKG